MNAANVTMGIGVAVIGYGSLGYLMSAGVTSLIQHRSESGS